MGFNSAFKGLSYELNCRCSSEQEAAIVAVTVRIV